MYSFPKTEPVREQVHPSSYYASASGPLLDAQDEGWACAPLESSCPPSTMSGSTNISVSLIAAAGGARVGQARVGRVCRWVDGTLREDVDTARRGF